MIPFPNKKYQVIYVDPPWKYNNSSFGTRKADKSDTLKEAYGAILRYPCMDLEEIKLLPVKNISENNSILFLWATGPFLEKAFQVISAWGFDYKTVAFVWTKTTQLSKGRPGSVDGWLKKNLGKWTLSSTEFCLLGTMGSIKKEATNIRQTVLAPIRKHSAKPIEVRNRIEQMFPHSSKIELFAVEVLDNWDAWGNEVTDKKLNDHYFI